MGDDVEGGGRRQSKQTTADADKACVTIKVSGLKVKGERGI